MNITTNKFIQKNKILHMFLLPIRLIKKIVRKLWKSPLPLGLWIINIFFQRILRINSGFPWMVHFTSRVIGEVSIGKNVWTSFALSGHCYVQGINGVIIGDETIFAPGVKIISANHDFKNFTVWVKERPIKIGKHCWIGTNAVILPGVELGDNVVVAAGSIVTKSFPSNCVVAGVPGKIIKELKDID